MHPRITESSRAVQLLIRTINEELQDIRYYAVIPEKDQKQQTKPIVNYCAAHKYRTPI